MGLTWPVLWEHKALKASSWSDTAKKGVQVSKPVYYGQLQIYMAYMGLASALFTALNKDSCELYHEHVPFDPRRAGAVGQGGGCAARRGRGRSAAAHRRSCRLLSLPVLPLQRPVLVGGSAMSLTLSDAQTRAIAAIRDWYLHRTHLQQVFRAFGYAGVGKTTITAMAIEALGLRPMTPGGLGGVIFAAFTGKAVHVMTQKGTPAQTIHSLIYRFSEATPEEIARVTEEMAALERDLPRMGVAERSFAETQIRQLKFRLDHIHEPRFVLNPQSALRDADLLVLDEVSMVGTDMAQDLMAFGKPILVLGDPGQLPPVKDTGFFTEATPDVMLTEVHRQAAESPILRLATLAREGRDIPFGAFDDQVWKMSRHEVSPAQMLHGGQVICGTHATRRRLNTAMKGAAGFDADYPAGPAKRSSACAIAMIWG